MILAALIVAIGMVVSAIIIGVAIEDFGRILSRLQPFVSEFKVKDFENVEPGKIYAVERAQIIKKEDPVEEFLDKTNA